MDGFVAGVNTANLVSLRLNLPYSKRTLVTILSALAKATPGLCSLGFLPFFMFMVRRIQIRYCACPIWRTSFRT
jgi:hypothetical protein